MVWIIGIGVLIWLTILILAILLEKQKKQLEQSYRDKQKKFYDRQEHTSFKHDRLYFCPDKNTFIKNGNGKKVLFVSLILSIIFIISLPLGLLKFMSYNDGSFWINFWGKLGLITFGTSIIGYIYYASKYHDVAETIVFGELYYDNSKDTLYYDRSILSFPRYTRTRRKIIVDACRIAYFGQKNVEQVIHSIQNISKIKVSRDRITILGEIIMTSFSERLQNNSSIDNERLNNYIESINNCIDEKGLGEHIINPRGNSTNSYIDFIELDKKTNFYDGEKNITMYSKKCNSIEIPRGYIGFEKFLISKNYLGSEKLHN